MANIVLIDEAKTLIELTEIESLPFGYCEVFLEMIFSVILL